MLVVELSLEREALDLRKDLKEAGLLSVLEEHLLVEEETHQHTKEWPQVSIEVS